MLTTISFGQAGEIKKEIKNELWVSIIRPHGLYKRTFADNKAWFLQINAGAHKILRSPKNMGLSGYQNYSIGFGMEARKSMHEKIELNIGARIHGGYVKSTHYMDSLVKFDNSLNVGIGLIAGIKYKLSDFFGIGIQYMPNVDLSFMNGENYLNMKKVKVSGDILSVQFGYPELYAVFSF